MNENKEKILEKVVHAGEKPGKGEHPPKTLKEIEEQKRKGKKNGKR